MNRRRQDDIPISPVRITFGAFMRAATTRLTDEQIIELIHQLEAELLSRAAQAAERDVLVDERPHGAGA